MSRLKMFHFMWADAWCSIRYGYDTILESSADDSISICCLVNCKPQTINLEGKEDSFIKSLEDCNIKSWHGKEYVNYNILMEQCG